MHLDCTIEPLGDGVVVTPSGEIDRDVAAELRQRLTEALSRAGTDGVQVDLSRVTFLDSSGLGALLAAHRDATVPFTVRNPSPQVKTIFEITNVWTLLAGRPVVPGDQG